MPCLTKAILIGYGNSALHSHSIVSQVIDIIPFTTKRRYFYWFTCTTIIRSQQLEHQSQFIMDVWLSFQITGCQSLLSGHGQIDWGGRRRGMSEGCPVRFLVVSACLFDLQINLIAESRYVCHRRPDSQLPCIHSIRSAKQTATDRLYLGSMEQCVGKSGTIKEAAYRRTSRCRQRTGHNYISGN